jgi:4-amino-4-deoxy-L-arabinose transferase-like glycosyltransferase
MRKFLIALVFLLGFILRIVNISSRPVGFTPDEASFGYDAYSILKTGKDQWGKPFPLVLRSFGDSKLPLYTYLTIPSVFLFGLNEFAVRLPNAIIGSLAVIIVYLLVKELFSEKDFGFRISDLGFRI